MNAKATPLQSAPPPAPPQLPIHQALVAVMRDLDAIGKDRRNAAQGYSFRGIDDVYNMLHPVLAKHGVFTIPTVVEERTEERTNQKGTVLIYRVMKIRYDFVAADGSSISATVIGEGMDSGDKAANKAMSVAQKYAFIQVLAIPTEESKDPEDDHHEVAPRTGQELHREPAGDGYNPAIQEHKQKLAVQLKAKKIPEDLWAKVSALMVGKGPDQLDDVIETVYAKERGEKR